MNHSSYWISLDIHDMASQVTISVKKGDNNRRICAVLTENGKPYKIADGVTAVFRAKKPADINGYRAIVYNNIAREDITANTIYYTLTSGNTEVSGEADCEFTLYGTNGEVLTSPRFTLVIDNTVNADNEVEEVGSNEVTALTALVSETSALKDEIETKLENGEFIGEKGDKGDIGEQGIQGIQGEKGDKGEAGYTPQKGVDYFTSEEQAAFTAAANAYTDEKVGDIETALDSIIAMQESLIGGGAE